MLERLGPRLRPPARVLELGCGDGTFGELLVERGYEYAGIDASAGMVDAARARLGPVVTQADFTTFRPAEDVDVTVCWNAIRYARDREAFFRLVREYTRLKLVFNFVPRDQQRADVVAELERAGFARTALRPFFVPQSRVLPRPLQAALLLAERVPPVARPLLRRRFTYVCAAWEPSATSI